MVSETIGFYRIRYYSNDELKAVLNIALLNK
jgi:hypothetical protein